MPESNNWNIKFLISDFLGGGSTLKPDPRKEIWASDLGKPLFDTINKMNGVKYTNPADGMGMMTFLLGKAIEQGVYNLLKDCGIAYESQERVTIETEGNLPVVGRPDLIVQVTDWFQVSRELDRLNKRDYRIAGMKEIVRRYQDQYPNGLSKTPFEIKSINSMALRYNKAKGMASAYPYHQLQLYTYMRYGGFNTGHLLYIAKDTGYIEEVVVTATPELEERWLTAVTEISQAYNTNTYPVPSAKITENGKTKSNWQVDYSPYKDLILSLQDKIENVIPDIVY